MPNPWCYTAIQMPDPEGKQEKEAELCGEGVTVAIIDTPLALEHEELRPRNGKTKVTAIYDVSVDKDGNFAGMSRRNLDETGAGESPSGELEAKQQEQHTGVPGGATEEQANAATASMWAPRLDLFHGTAVAGCIAGWEYGVAKKASVVSFALPPRDKVKASMFIELFDAILDHFVKEEVGEEKGMNFDILNFSLVIPQGLCNDAVIDSFADVVQQFGVLGIVLVAPAGDEPKTETDRRDAQWKSRPGVPAAIPGVFSVGSLEVQDDGRFAVAQTSRSGLKLKDDLGKVPDAVCPGKSVCAACSRTGQRDLMDGSSFGCALAAGAMALVVERLRRDGDDPTVQAAVKKFRACCQPIDPDKPEREGSGVVQVKRI